MLLANKLTKQLKEEAEKQHIPVIVKLKNIVVNDKKTGCSGHITDINTGGCVYINTEGSSYEPLKGKAMCRYAKNDKDWSSTGLKNGQNHWKQQDDIAKFAIAMLSEGIGNPKEAI